MFFTKFIKIAVSSERKREGTTSNVPPTKKPKIGSYAGSPGESTTAVDIDPLELVPSALAAFDNHNTDKLVPT